MNEKIQEQMNKLNQCLIFGKKKIIYHENAHLLLGYFFGMKCNYVDYTIRIGAEYKDNSYEVEFESQAHAYIISPIETYFAFLRLGGTKEQYIDQYKVSEQFLQDETIAYLAMLYAGYQAEQYFFSGKEYDDLKKFALDNSQDFTKKDVTEDNAKAQMIMSDIGYNADGQAAIKKFVVDIINTVFVEEKMKFLFDELFKKSVEKNVLLQKEIEEFLEKNEYFKWAGELKEKLIGG